MEILRQEPGRVAARVSGTEDHRTVPTGSGTDIGGQCSCPAFEDWGFCKHLVAVALTADESDADDGSGPIERIRMRKLLVTANALVRDQKLFAAI